MVFFLIAVAIQRPFQVVHNTIFTVNSKGRIPFCSIFFLLTTIHMQYAREKRNMQNSVGYFQLLHALWFYGISFIVPGTFLARLWSLCDSTAVHFYEIKIISKLKLPFSLLSMDQMRLVLLFSLRPYTHIRSFRFASFLSLHLFRKHFHCFVQSVLQMLLRASKIDSGRRK